MNKGNRWRLTAENNASVSGEFDHSRTDHETLGRGKNGEIGGKGRDARQDDGSKDGKQGFGEIKEAD